MKTVTATFAVDFDFSESIDSLEQLEEEPFTDEQIEAIVIEDVLNAISNEGSPQHVTVRINNEAETDYLANCGTKCPHCGSAELTGRALEVDAMIAWQPMSCETCGASWTDLFKLTGIANLVVPN